MDEYSELIWVLVVLVLLGIPRIVKWYRDQAGTVWQEGEHGRSHAGIDERVQILKKATERGIPKQASVTVRPEGRAVQPEEKRQQRTEVRAGKRATELRKAPSSSPSRLFQNSDDLRKAVIWAEVLRRPVSRRLRGRRPFVHVGTP